MAWLYNCMECNGWFDNIENPPVESYRVYTDNTPDDELYLCADCAGDLLFGKGDRDEGFPDNT